MRTLLLIALLLMASCTKRAEYFNVENVEVVEIVGDEYPTAATLNVLTNNSIGAFTVKDMRIRLGIEGRRQVVITLTEKATFKRGWQVVKMPLKISVVRNSLTMKLQEALLAHDAKSIEADGEIRVRRGLFTVREQLGPKPLDELFTEEQLEIIWNAIDENKK